MANNMIEIDTSALNADLSSIRQDIESLKAEARTLRSAADALGATWEGPAKEEWTRQIREDTDALEELIDVIFRFAQRTDESRRAYEQCENSVGQLIDSIRV